MKVKKVVRFVVIRNTFQLQDNLHCYSLISYLFIHSIPLRYDSFLLDSLLLQVATDIFNRCEFEQWATNFGDVYVQSDVNKCMKIRKWILWWGFRPWQNNGMVSVSETNQFYQTWEPQDSDNFLVQGCVRSRCMVVFVGDWWDSYNDTRMLTIHR